MLGKTDRTGKFGKIFLIIYRNPSCTVELRRLISYGFGCACNLLTSSSFVSRFVIG